MSIPEQVLAGINRLEPLPITVQKLLASLGQDSVNFKEIASTAEYDGAVAANILRVANSAAFGGRFHIESLRDAIVRLGTTTLLDIILGDYLRAVKAPAPLYDLTEDDLWLHGATASLAVKAMMQETRSPAIPKVATIAALVHDIGKLIMVRYLKADVSTILSLCEEKNITFVEAEEEIFGCNHAQVGGVIARKWAFPEPITQAIESHHDISSAETAPIVDAVMLANLAAKSVGVGLGAAGLNMRMDYSGSRQRLGLTMEGFERACAQTQFWVIELKRNYGMVN
jgi:putative nucleotidyltransferase with HDIG domain